MKTHDMPRRLHNVCLDAYRMLRFGPALYLATRRLGCTRRRSLSVVVWP